jgi:hypothetical protein
MKRVICIWNGCGILETTCLSSTNVKYQYKNIKTVQLHVQSSTVSLILLQHQLSNRLLVVWKNEPLYDDFITAE